LGLLSSEWVSEGGACWAPFGAQNRALVLDQHPYPKIPSV
jgi:hypothetical protein